MTRRSRLGGSVPAPVVLPHVVVRPDGAETVTITVDRDRVSDEPIPRVQLGEAIGQIVEQVAAPVRVEVHEPDGAVYADILTPPADQTGDPPPAAKRPHRRGRPPQVEVSGDGFLPGEAVHVAVTLATATADSDGHISVHLDPRRARGNRGPVLKVGATSGTTLVQDVTQDLAP